MSINVDKKDLMQVLSTGVNSDNILKILRISF